MPYLYDDEDNVSMNDEDSWRKYTVYSCKAEADYYENGGYDADREAKDEERLAIKKERMDNLLDKLGIDGGCRECPWIVETLEGFMDDDYQVGSNQFNFVRSMCAGCHGKGTGEVDPVHDKRLAKQWAEIKDWCKNCTLNDWRCPWCDNVYAVYGQYKDPDDEWDAIEELCGKCPHFGED